MSLDNTPEETKLERSLFVQELVISTIKSKSDNGEQIPLHLKSLLKMVNASPIDLLKLETEEQEAESKQSVAARQSNVVLRGRARSDAQNAKRRAEANRVSVETKQKSDDENNTSSR